VAIALPCVAALGKLVQSQLFGVSATDPTTVAEATLLLGAASIAAALVPAVRAARLNPTDALRLD
jgi:ABC-type antimicrobial peptide transport system permease subunit